jgi:replicative DNA helicase
MVQKLSRKQAREFINSRLTLELKKARVSGYICPFCGSGSGKNGTGIETLNGQHYKCFNCEFYGDYLHMLKQLHNTDKEWDIFMMYGLKIDTAADKTVAVAKKGDDVTPRISSVITYNKEDDTTDPKPYIERTRDRCNAKETVTTDYTQYFIDCHANVGKTDYFTRRGISVDLINNRRLGYDPVTRQAIIPTSKGSYFARATDPNAPIQKQKIGGSYLYNIEALQSEFGIIIYITEGELDALSVLEVGGQALALGSTRFLVMNNANFIFMTKREKINMILVVSYEIQ